MADQEYDEAKLIYELLTKSGKVISEDSIDEIAQILNFSITGEKLKERIARLEKGLPIEDEFIALATWLGKCKLIHKLDQEQLPLESIQNYQVPDLYAIFEYEGGQIPVVIEVKAEDPSKSSKNKLLVGNKLYKKLINYASIAKLPLLIAWRADGDWLLFEIERMKKVERAFHM